MAIKADFHTHSYFSDDTTVSTEEMIKGAVDKGLDHLFITEHLDYKFGVSPRKPEPVIIDEAGYHREMEYMKDKYAGKIRLLKGIEIGMQPHLTKENTDFAKKNGTEMKS